MGLLGRFLRRRLGWSVAADDRDYVLGFGGHYGRGENVGSVNGQTVTQGVDPRGTAVDYTFPFTHLFNIGRALGIYKSASAKVWKLPVYGGHGVLSRGGWAQMQFNTGYGIDEENPHDLPVGLRDRNQNTFGNFIFSLRRPCSSRWSIAA